MRKAQIAGQIFVYIIAIVVVGLIVVYGYSAIKTFTQRGEEMEFITLKTDMENDVKRLVSDFGTVKRPDFNIPGKYTHVCFVDRDSEPSGPLCQEGNKLHQPIACSAWGIGRDNVFLIPDGADSFDVGEIVIKRTDDYEGEQSHICFEVVSNKIPLQLKGLGDRVEISEYEIEE